MAKKVKAIVLTGNGANCEMEMAHACRLASADQVDIVHISELLFVTAPVRVLHIVDLDLLP